MTYQKPTFKHIGHGHVIQINRVTAIVPPSTATAREYLRRAKNAGLYIDASLGHRYRSIIILDDGFVVSSAISVSTLLKRFSEDFDTDYTNQKQVEEEMEDLFFEPQDDVDE